MSLTLIEACFKLVIDEVVLNIIIVTLCPAELSLTFFELFIAYCVQVFSVIQQTFIQLSVLLELKLDLPYFAGLDAVLSTDIQLRDC